MESHVRWQVSFLWKQTNAFNEAKDADYFPGSYASLNPRMTVENLWGNLLIYLTWLMVSKNKEGNFTTERVGLEV